MILDLRDCAGEEFEEGVKVANFFLDHGVITYTQGQKSPKKEFVADPAKALDQIAPGGAAELRQCVRSRDCVGRDQGKPARRTWWA